MKNLFIILACLSLPKVYGQINLINEAHINNLELNRRSESGIYFHLNVEVTNKRFRLEQLITSEGDTVWVSIVQSSSEEINGLIFKLSAASYRQIRGRTITHLVDCQNNISLKVVNEKRVKLKKKLDVHIDDKVLIHGYGIYGKNYFNNSDSSLYFIKLNFSALKDKMVFSRIGLELSNGKIIILEKAKNDFLTKQTFRYKDFSRYSNQLILHISYFVLDEMKKNSIKRFFIYKEEGSIRKIHVLNPQKISSDF